MKEYLMIANKEKTKKKKKSIKRFYNKWLGALMITFFFYGMLNYIIFNFFSLEYFIEGAFAVAICYFSMNYIDELYKKTIEEIK